MTINSILKNHKSIRTWFIVTIVLGSVSLLGLLFVGVWGIFNGMADLCWLFFIVGFFIAINAIGVCIALLGFAVTIDKAKLAEVGADGCGGKHREKRHRYHFLQTGQAV